MPLFKNIIILFPPGGGGNNIANLISTHPSVNNRNNDSDYLSNLNSIYTTSVDNAHASLDPGAEVNEKAIDAILASNHNPLTNVLCSHVFHYYALRHKFNKLENRCFITINVEMNTKLQRRISAIKNGRFGFNYDSTVAYREEVIAALSGLQYDRIFTMPGKFLEDPSCTEISKFFNMYLNIQLPDEAFALHKTWVERQLSGY